MKYLIVLFCCFMLPVSFSQAEEQHQVSGRLSTGFRVLDVDPAHRDNMLTVYRGDYIKLSYSNQLGSLPFVMTELGYKDALFPDPEKSAYFKMKAVGSYAFTLGEGGGKITVKELVRPNYIEVTAEEAKKLLDNVHPFILDVRTPGEYQQVHIDGSELIPIQDLQKRVGELSSKKHEDIFVYCATGNRSTVAAKILGDQGFKRIYNLRYGVYDWARRGYPYKTGK